MKLVCSKCRKGNPSLLSCIHTFAAPRVRTYVPATCVRLGDKRCTHPMPSRGGDVMRDWREEAAEAQSHSDEARDDIVARSR